MAAADRNGALAPSQLVIHPVYGPWFALRAVILGDGDPPDHAPIAQPCRCDTRCTDALAAALQLTESRPDWRAWVAVRDACGLRGWRYSEDQLHYHYSRAWNHPP